MADVSRSVIDKDADWEAAEATLKSGGRVLLESDANGRLTVGDENPVCMLMSVGQAKITVSEAPEALVAEPPQPAALTIGKTDFAGTNFAGKNLGERESKARTSSSVEPSTTFPTGRSSPPQRRTERATTPRSR